MVSKEAKVKELEEKLDALKRKIDSLELEEGERESLEGMVRLSRKALSEGRVGDAVGMIKGIVVKIKSARKVPKKAKRPKKEAGVRKEDAIALLKRVKELMDAGSVPEESLNQARELFSRGQAHFREGRFGEAVEALKEAEGVILKAKAAEEVVVEEKPEEVAEAGGEEAKVVREGEEEKVEGEVKEVAEVRVEKPEEMAAGEAEEAEVEKEGDERFLKILEEFFGRLERLRGLGGDTSPIEEHIRFIEGARETGDLKGAAEVASSLLEWLDQYIASLEEKAEEEVRREEEGIREKIDEFLGKVEEIRGLGGDTAPINEHLAYIKGSLSTGDLKGALAVVETLEEWVETYLNTLRAQAEEKVEKETVEAVGKREEVREEEVVEKAAEEVVEKAEEEEREEERLRVISQKLEEYEREIEELSGEGLDTAPLRRIHTLARGKLEEGDLKNVEDLLGRLEVARRNLLKMKYESRLGDLRKRVEERVEYFKSQGVDVDAEDLIKLMASIESELEEGDAGRVKELMEELERRLSNFERDAYNMLYQRRMIPLINGIKGLEEKGVDVTRLRAHLESVKEKFMAGDYAGWEGESLQLQRSLQAYEANHLLNRLREAVVRLGEVGGPQAEYTQKYNEAVEAYKKGSFEAVIKMCEEAIPGAERLYREHSFRRLKENFTQLIAQGEQLGVETETFRDALNRSEELFSRGEVDEARRTIEGALNILRAEVEKAQSQRRRAEELSGEINEIWNRLLTMARSGYPTSEVSRKVQSVRNLLKELKVDEATTLIEEIHADMQRLTSGPAVEEKPPEAEEELDTLRAKELSIIISQIRERITRMRELGMDTGKYQSDLLTMLQTFKRGELDRAVEQGRVCLSNIKKELGES